MEGIVETSAPESRQKTAAVRKLMEQIRAEYKEMPGLSVTMPQAQRLWAVDQNTCKEVLNRLVANGMLRMTSKGRFIRS